MSEKFEELRLRTLRNRENYVTLHESPAGKAFADSEKAIRATLKDIQQSSSLTELVKAEQTMLKIERAAYSNSPNMAKSLDLAILSSEITLKNIERVATPETYRGVDQAHQLPKNRRAGLPIDEARQFFKSQNTRLLNMDKSRLTAEEKQTIETRRANMRHAEKLYTQAQTKALGLTEQKDKSKTPSLSR